MAHSSNNSAAPLIRGGGGMLIEGDAVWLTSEMALAFGLVPFVVNSTVTHPSSYPDIG